MKPDTTQITARLQVWWCHACAVLQGRADKRPIHARVSHEAWRHASGWCPYRTPSYTPTRLDRQSPLPPDEYLSCGCWAAAARAHHPKCTGRHVLLDGHYWSSEEIADGWYLRAVLTGQLWMTNTPPPEVDSWPHLCTCDGCSGKPRPTDE